jgi:hypothetical protein
LCNMLQGDTAALGQGRLAHFGFAEQHDLLGLGGVGDHLEIVACFGHGLQPQDLDGRGWLGLADLFSAIVQHGAHFAEDRAADEIVAHMQGPVADQHGGHRPAAAIQLGLQHIPHGRACGIGFQILQIGHEQDHLQQQIQVDPHLGGNGHHHGIAAPILRQQAAIGELLLDALRLGIRLVDLVNGDDDGDLGCAGVVDGFQGLRHHAVVGRHHQHHDIGDFGAAGAHAGERFVAWSIDEDHFASVFFNVVCADVLGDSAGFLAGHVGFADGVQQRGFTMIDVSHDGDHGRAFEQILLFFGNLIFLLRFFFVSNCAGGSSELACHLRRELGIERLVDRSQNVAVHQFLDDHTGLHIQLLGKFLHRDAFRDGNLTADRRRPGSCLTAGGRPQNLLFGLRAPISLLRTSAVTSGAALLIGRRRRDRGLHTGTARGRMHRARSAGAHGCTRPDTRTRTRALPGNHRLSRAQGSTVDRLSRRGSALRPRKTRTDRTAWRGRPRHTWRGCPGLPQLGRQIRARRYHGTRDGLSGKRARRRSRRRRNGSARRGG